MPDEKRKRGGDVKKKAPPGFLTARGARERLGISQSALQTMVTKGELERVIPPLRTEGFYRETDVNKLAYAKDLFYLQQVSTAKYEPTDFMQASSGDADGIANVLASLWGPDVTPAELRRTWYRTNDRIDFVVKFRSLVLGYINMVPYYPDVLEDMMAGRKRGWDIRPHDILPFESGKEYDVFIGIAIRQDIPGHKYYAKRLIYGFFGALSDMVQEGIIIRRMYATSDQEFGIQISQDLGFVRQPEQPGDRFGRFVLDMQTANSVLVRKYREVVEKCKAEPQGRVRLSKRIAHDPKLEETLQELLELLNSIDIAQHAQVISGFLSLLSQMSESSQMSIEQQVLLRSIYEVVAARYESQ